MNFRAKLENIVKKNNSLVCIGLDSDFDKLPEFIKSRKRPLFEFNKEIIDATHNLVCAYKPNSAFYEARGVEGLKDLKLTFGYLRDNYPEIVTILDAKRADIGNSNRGYVSFAFDYLGADAITLHPYFGREALKPFLDRVEKGVFILCRTSNPGAGEFQDLETNGRALYQIVAERVVKYWNNNGNCGLVVAATYPTELKIVRRIAKDLPLLIPGIGKQGADLEKTVKFGTNETGQNAIINSSRRIIFAGKGRDFAIEAREEAEKLQALINNFRQS